MTRKGQVTIPAHIRRLLGLTERARVAFVINEGRIELAPALSVADRTAGMLKTSAPALSPRDEKAAAEATWAEEAE